jgi:hypothetical protein
VPNSKWKPGQTVSIKIALADAAGSRLRACANCSVKFEAVRLTDPVSGKPTGQAAGPTSMKYDAANQQYLYNWKLGPARHGTGPTKLLATVTYPDGTSTTRSETVVITSS